jgi:hypothetical protein
VVRGIPGQRQRCEVPQVHAPVPDGVEGREESPFAASRAVLRHLLRLVRRAAGAGVRVVTYDLGSTSDGGERKHVQRTRQESYRAHQQSSSSGRRRQPAACRSPAEHRMRSGRPAQGGLATPGNRPADHRAFAQQLTPTPCGREQLHVLAAASVGLLSFSKTLLLFLDESNSSRYLYPWLGRPR